MSLKDRFMRSAIFIIHLVVSHNTVHGCRTSYIHQARQGYRCLSPIDIFYNVSAVAYPQCIWHCLRRNNCLMLLYNTHFYCFLASDSCQEAEHDDSVTMTYFGLPHNDNNGGHVCLQWTTNEGDWPQNLLVVNDNANGNDYAVARLIIGDILLPGAYRNGKTKSTMGGTRRSSNGGEYLLVHPVCFVMWVVWDSTSGSDLPTVAIVGGHLANGVPLYIAKGWTKPSLMKIGYYNPETFRGHFWAESEYLLTEMSLLVQFWTTHENHNWLCCPVPVYILQCHLSLLPLNGSDFLLSTVPSRYIAVIFLRITHERHPIPHP